MRQKYTPPRCCKQCGKSIPSTEREYDTCSDDCAMTWLVANLTLWPEMWRMEVPRDN